VVGTFHLVLTKLLSPDENLGGRQANARVGLEKLFWDKARTAWLLHLLLFVVGILTIL
jgi:hypothetical protein